METIASKVSVNYKWFSLGNHLHIIYFLLEINHADLFSTQRQNKVTI